MRNVIVLGDIPKADSIPVDVFRSKILGPLFQEIEARGLTGTIQGVAYSADFPTAIQLDSDLASLRDKSPYLTPVGSINGMTFLFRYSQAKVPTYIGFESNWYAARPLADILRAMPILAEEQKQLDLFEMESQHEQAAQLLDTISKRLYEPCSLVYRSAQKWALAGNPPTAIQRLKLCLERGWRYRYWIANDASFASLKEEAAFRELLQNCPNEDSQYGIARGFNARTYYAPDTTAFHNSKHGISFLLSVMLSCNGAQGNSEAESIDQLLRSIRADFTQPRGTFVFASTDDVRTKTREPHFQLAIDRLKQKGFEAIVVRSPLPSKGTHCSGAMLGAASFQWKASGAELLPGALADNLTSLGGAMSTASQTKLTELLRHGAAMSSGAVTEPYAIQNKFPHPMMHAHYANGLTAAEAYYSSVLCPYQLLMVGDPLCQPFAKPPRFEVEGIQDRQRIDGPLKLRFRASNSEQIVAPERFSWIIDSKLAQDIPVVDFANIAFAPGDLGAYELRLVSTGPQPIESRFERCYWLLLGAQEDQLELQAPQQWSRSDGEKLRITLVRNRHNTPVQLRHDHEVIATFAPDQTHVDLTVDQVGYGPVRLQATTTDELQHEIKSLPIVIEVKRGEASQSR